MRTGLVVLVGLVPLAAFVAVISGFAAEDGRRPLPTAAVVAGACAWFVVLAVVMLLTEILTEIRDAA